MTAMALSAKEEAFAQAVAAGATLSAAYRSSRDTSRMTTATVNANSKKLARRPGVRARIAELRESQRESGGPRESSPEPRGEGAHSGPTPEPQPGAEPSPKPGRPTVYSDDMASGILSRLAAGEPLRAICREEGMPDESTVRGWATDENHPFSVRYSRARDVGLLSMADQILEIADDAVSDEAIAQAKVRIQARQWTLAKAMPHRFGERLEHAGKVGIEDLTPPQPRHPGAEQMALVADRCLAGLMKCGGPGVAAKALELAAEYAASAQRLRDADDPEAAAEAEKERVLRKWAGDQARPPSRPNQRTIPDV
jgi:hypothetical protein